MNWVSSFVKIILTTYKRFNLDDMTTKEDNKDWPCRKLIIGPSGSGKTNYLLNSIQKDNNIINKRIVTKKRKVLIVFDDMISHVM